MAKVKFTAAEVAEKTGLAKNTVTTYCKQGKVPGAYMEGKRWMMTAESLQAFENVKPRADHERIGKRLQFVLGDEPERKPEEKPTDAPKGFPDVFVKKINAETAAKIMDMIDEPVQVIDVSAERAPELEWMDNPDPAIRALIDTAWRLAATMLELATKAGYRLAQLADEEETEIQA